jgi:hypothetical protein
MDPSATLSALAGSTVAWSRATACRVILALIPVLFLSAPTCEREPLPVPTRAEIQAWKPNGSKLKPVSLKGKQLEALTRLLGDPATYDREHAAACFEPQHAVTLYNGKSVIDRFELCFHCHNIEVSGINPWVGCEPDGSLPKHMSLTDDAYEKIRKILLNANVKNVPSATAD